MKTEEMATAVQVIVGNSVSSTSKEVVNSHFFCPDRKAGLPTGDITDHKDVISHIDMGS